jgi:hypothetical protein
MFAKRHLAVIGGVILLSLSVPSFGTVVTDLQYFPMDGALCYDSSTTQFYLNDTGDGGTIKRANQTQWDNITLGQISLTGAVRTAEQSSGGSAKAWFSYADPIYLEISGQIRQPDNTLIYSGLLLRALLVADLSTQTGAPDSTSFCVWELGAPSPNVLSAHLFFEMVGGELYAGTSGKQTDWVMQDFELTMELESENVIGGFGTWSVDNFYNDIQYQFWPQTILLHAIPEPGTVSLLGLGLLLFRRRRTR